MKYRSAIGAAAIAALALTACSLGGSGGSATSSGSGGSGGSGGTDKGTVQVVTHDNFHVDEALLAEFTESTGYQLTFSAPGDAGALVNQLILTKDSPLGDVVFGVDNAFGPRAVAAGIFEDYSAADLPASAKDYLLGDALTPVDMGDVCLNVDHTWFTEKGLAEPVTLEDVTKPEYKDLTVLTNPATSSPGLAFLLATIGAFGADGWTGYWTQLKDNGAKVVDSWSDAYQTDFTASGNGGTRPIVLSYATSPAFLPTTGALLDTCFRQVEYAGVLKGAKNPDGAKAFVDFLLSAKVQADIPGQMYMYPVDTTVELPADWTAHAPIAPKPFTVQQADLETKLDSWQKTWQDTFLK